MAETLESGERLRAILDEIDATSLGEGDDVRHVDPTPVQVRDDDSDALRRDDRFERSRVGRERLGIDVDGNDVETVMANNASHIRDVDRRHDDLGSPRIGGHLEVEIERRSDAERGETLV